MKKRIAALLLALAMVMTCVCANAEPVKKERVYVIANAAGEIQKIIDNVRLSNPDQSAALADRTRLTDIENVGGHEAFTLDGESLIWNADGSDIHYQGIGSASIAAVPVVTYELDGTSVTAEELSGKSGVLTIHVNYPQDMSSPVLALSVMSVPAGMSDITVENAMLMDEGGKQMIIGYAIPGADSALELPADFTVTGQADHIDLSWMMTFVTGDPITLLCGELNEKVLDADTLIGNVVSMLTALKDGTEMPEFEGDLNEIASGLSTLLNGVDTLAEGATTLSTGASDLDAGADSLETGLTTLIENNEALTSGASQLFDAILATANAQLASSGLDAVGIILPELTADTYSVTLDTAVEQLNAMIEQGKEAAEGQIRAVVLSNESTIREAVTQAVRGQVLTGVLAAAKIDMTAEDYAAAVKGGLVSAETAAQIDGAVTAQLETEEIKATIDTAVNEKIDELVAENLASEDVQTQLNEQTAPALAAIDALTGLKDQLDQVNTFVTGLTAYTDGVSQAQAGSVTLHTGTTQLSTGAAALSEGADQLKTGMHSAVTDAADQLLPYLTENVQMYIDAFKRTKADADAAEAYDLVADDMDSETVYVIRTDLK